MLPAKSGTALIQYSMLPKFTGPALLELLLLRLCFSTCSVTSSTSIVSMSQHHDGNSIICDSLRRRNHYLRYMSRSFGTTNRDRACQSSTFSLNTCGVGVPFEQRDPSCTSHSQSIEKDTNAASHRSPIKHHRHRPRWQTVNEIWQWTDFFHKTTCYWILLYCTGSKINRVRPFTCRGLWCYKTE